MKNISSFERLLTIMDELREKCPWDQKQTMESLSHLTIEETYELIDAILIKDMTEIKGELGDLLLHIVFYSKIASESNHFNINDVIHSVSEKLIERHPHIYGNEVATTEEQVKRNWEKIKLKKGRKSVLEGVPKSLDHEVNQENNSTKIEKEFGDVLFSLINYARFIGVDPESALERTNKKFISRFSFLENEIKEKGLKFESMNLQEMDEIWNKSKKIHP